MTVESLVKARLRLGARAIHSRNLRWPRCLNAVVGPLPHWNPGPRALTLGQCSRRLLRQAFLTAGVVHYTSELISKRTHCVNVLQEHYLDHIIYCLNSSGYSYQVHCLRGVYIQSHETSARASRRAPMRCTPARSSTRGMA